MFAIFAVGQQGACSLQASTRFARICRANPSRGMPAGGLCPPPSAVRGVNRHRAGRIAAPPKGGVAAPPKGGVAGTLCQAKPCVKRNFLVIPIADAVTYALNALNFKEKIVK
jgi:hypothetical protein